MAKIKNNPIMKGVSGMLGKVVVYRQVRGNVIMCNRPKKRKVLTQQQEQTKARFLRAVQYAKKQVAAPEIKALYEPKQNSKFTSAYAAAVGDYLSSPTIHMVDTTAYNGKVGDPILIKASDNFMLTSVHISIFNSSGYLLEQSELVLQQDSAEDYVYTTTVANAIVRGTQIIVSVRDRPGNITTEEKVI